MPSHSGCKWKVAVAGGDAGWRSRQAPIRELLCNLLELEGKVIPFVAEKDFLFENQYLAFYQTLGGPKY